MDITTAFKERGGALLALILAAVVPGAQAANTASSTEIANRATLTYSIGGVAQDPIGSSPTGNTSGAGSDTTFVVDNKILHTVTELSGSATVTTPGATLQITSFSVTNTGNTAQGYLLEASNLGADDFEVADLAVRVDSDGDGSYDDTLDTAEDILSLAPGDSVTVFVLATIPLSAGNGQSASVQLAAQATEDGTTDVAQETVGADRPGDVDIVFADGGADPRDGIHEATDQYSIESAALSVEKTSRVVSDPFNLTTDPKAIPGAVVEYTITVTNAGTTAAAAVQITDPMPANTMFAADAYGTGADVELQVGAATPTTCEAEAGSDSNSDGCYIDGSGRLVVVIGTVDTGAGNAVAVRFRVTID